MSRHHFDFDATAAIDAWKAGDLLAGSRLVKMYDEFISLVMRQYVTSRCELDDLRQIGRLAILKAATEYNKSKGDWLKYARIVLKHRARDFKALRLHDSSKFVSLDSDDSPEVAAPSQEDTSAQFDLELVDRILANIPPRQRDALLRFCAGESIADISSATGRPRSTVRWDKAKAEKKLREALRTS